MTLITLTRFRWVFCQLETLRQCLPQSVRRTLNELPESLDETYERVMMEIKKNNQVHAYRMLQCLTVANRPLSVAEVAELVAFDFDVANGGIPKLKSDWRWEDHEQAVLSTCSSLITVVPGRRSPIVQFSHFSVKEFLMSDRLATSKRDISQYHISLEDAHTVLAKACLGVLLRVPDFKNRADRGPLTRYAAEQWVAHAQIENVASRVRDGMEYLFDPDKPYFEAWVQSHDVDPRTFHGIRDPEPGARALYYAALCGFHELVEHLTSKYPQYTSAPGGRLGTALHSASFAGHLQIVRLLLRLGVGVDVRGDRNCTPLRFASQSGHRDIVQCLLDHGADVNSQEDDHNTPLNWAAVEGHVDVVQVLLEHNADVNSKDDNGQTPLHDAIWCYHSKGDYPQVVRLLLEHGANTNARDAKLRTPLHTLSMSKHPNLDVARILLEHGADVDAEDEKGRTPLRVAAEEGRDEMAQLLSKFRSIVSPSRVC
jgi:ankyrin repeat protein